MPTSAFALGASLLVLALHATAVLFALRAIRSARTPQGALGWTLFLLVLPWVGVPAFLIFGDFRYHGMVRERRRSDAAARRARSDTDSPTPDTEDDRGAAAAPDPLRTGFEAIAERPTVSGNEVRLLVDADAFHALFAAIDAARTHILIETYILRDDRLGRELRQRLGARAAAGVRVRVLYDPFGSHALDRTYLDAVRAAGIEIVDFHARRGAPWRAPMRLNFRNHRKIAVIDGAIGFTGGFNFGDEYLGRDPKLGAWRDTMVRLEGPVVDQLQAVFAEDWHWATDEPPGPPMPARRVETGVPALLLASGPADDRETGMLYFLQAITEAKRRIWIATPYFTPDPGLMNALRLAAARGVDVRVIMADRRDHWLVWLAAFAFLDQMRGSGVRIWRYREGFMHQKIVLVDDAAAIGSHNLDGRSCRLNFEASALVFDPAFAETVATMLEADFARADLHDRPLAEAPLLVRLGAPFARLFAPIL